MVDIYKKSFWHNLPRPFFVIAPMADVTDVVFRDLFVKYSRGLGGGPDVFYTQFVSCDGLCSPGREVLLTDFKYTEPQRPIVAQIFGSNPDTFFKTAALIAELGFDGIDINMGCPDKSVEKQGAGAALIKNPTRARELIRAAKEGAKSAGRALPVAVKTRVGYNKNELETWIPEILAEHPAALTIHARTRKEMSKVPARWEEVARVVELAREIQKGIPDDERTLIIGNGDVTTLAEGKVRAEETGADGVMVGRGIFGNPWFFSGVVCPVHDTDIAHPAPYFSQPDPECRCVTIPEKLRVLVEHTRDFENRLGQFKNFAIMKKHYKAYVSGFDGAKELRVKLMDAENADEVERIVAEFSHDKKTQ